MQRRLDGMMGAAQRLTICGIETRAAVAAFMDMVGKQAMLGGTSGAALPSLDPLAAPACAAHDFEPPSAMLRRHQFGVGALRSELDAACIEGREARRQRPHLRSLQHAYGEACAQFLRCAAPLEIRISIWGWVFKK